MDGAVEIGYRDADGSIHVVPHYRIAESELARYVEVGTEAGRRHVPTIVTSVLWLSPAAVTAE